MTATDVIRAELEGVASDPSLSRDEKIDILQDVIRNVRDIAENFLYQLQEER